MTIQMKRIPVTQPSATQIVLSPSAYACPVRPRRSQADSPVARSESARAVPPNRPPPRTNSLWVRGPREYHQAMETVATM